MGSIDSQKEKLKQWVGKAEGSLTFFHPNTGGKFTQPIEKITLASYLPLYGNGRSKIRLSRMENLVTRCPQCNTSFRITPAQLKTARGAVRCGSCLTIFKATDNLITEKPRTSAGGPKAATPPAAAQTTQTKAPTKPETATRPETATSERAPEQAPAPSDEVKAKDDDMLISDDMLEDTAVFSRVIEDEIDISALDSHKPASSSLFERRAKPIKDEPLDHSDESWAVNLLEEAEGDVTAKQAAVQSSDLLSENTAQDSAANFSVGKFSLPEQTSTPTDKPINEDHTGSFTLIADQEEDNLDELSLPEEEDSDPLAQLEEFEQRSRPQDTSNAAPSPIRAIDPERAALLQSIEPDPVEMAFRVEARTWPKKLLWGGLSLTALLALFIQWNIYNFYDLSRMDPYRSWYSTLCPVLGCKLPSLSAPEKISNYNLVVRTHPSANNALIVDTILLNRAPFTQPFPKLVLTFSDRDHNPIASRSFTPAEYLRGELAGRKQMPSGQPVHIALELADPGTNAVNYSAAIEAN